MKQNLKEFSKHVAKLKTIERTGWIRYQIPKPETVADHSFGTALLAMILAKKYKLDQLKVVKMALVHDLGEAIIGDIVTGRGRTDGKKLREKIAMERKAVREISSLIGSDEVLDLFNEFEENKTPEARFVKQLDKLEMAIQAYQYEKAQDIDLEEFYQSTFAKIKDRRLKAILEEVYSSRQKRKRR